MSVVTNTKFPAQQTKTTQQQTPAHRLVQNLRSTSQKNIRQLKLDAHRKPTITENHRKSPLQVIDEMYVQSETRLKEKIGTVEHIYLKKDPYKYSSRIDLQMDNLLLDKQKNEDRIKRDKEIQEHLQNRNLQIADEALKQQKIKHANKMMLVSDTESILSRRSFSQSPGSLKDVADKYLKRMEEKEAKEKASKWNDIDKYGNSDTFVKYKNNKFYDKVTMDKVKLAKLKQSNKIIAVNMKREKILDEQLKSLKKGEPIEEVEDPYKNNFNFNIIPLAHVQSKDAKRALRTFGQMSLVPMTTTKKHENQDLDETSKKRDLQMLNSTSENFLTIMKTTNSQSFLAPMSKLETSFYDDKSSIQQNSVYNSNNKKFATRNGHFRSTDYAKKASVPTPKEDNEPQYTKFAQNVFADLKLQHAPLNVDLESRLTQQNFSHFNRKNNFSRSQSTLHGTSYQSYRTSGSNPYSSEIGQKIVTNKNKGILVQKKQKFVDKMLTKVHLEKGEFATIIPQEEVKTNLVMKVGKDLAEPHDLLLPKLDGFSAKDTRNFYKRSSSTTQTDLLPCYHPNRDMNINRNKFKPTSTIQQKFYLEQEQTEVSVQPSEDLMKKSNKKLILSLEKLQKKVIPESQIRYSRNHEHQKQQLLIQLKKQSNHPTLSVIDKRSMRNHSVTVTPKNMKGLMNDSQSFSAVISLNQETSKFQSPGQKSTDYSPETNRSLKANHQQTVVKLINEAGKQNLANRKLLLDITHKQVKNEVEHAEKCRVQNIIRLNANLEAKVIKVLNHDAEKEKVLHLKRVHEERELYESGVGDPSRVVAKMEGRTRLAKNAKNKKKPKVGVDDQYLNIQY